MKRTAQALSLFIVLSQFTANSQARYLKNLEWVQPENLKTPIILELNGDQHDLDQDIVRVTEYFAKKPFDYYFVPQKNPIVSNNKNNCVTNLKKNIYQLRSRDKPVSLPHNLSWSEDPFNDRNWQFKFHSWDFMDCLLYGHIAYGDPWYLERMKWIVHDWWKDNFKPEFPSKEFSWYDHTIPRRLHSLLQVWEHVRRSGALDEEFVRVSIRFIYWHARILAEEEELYVKHHNHGLDQSFRLFQVSQLFPEFEIAKKWKELARTRLSDEIAFALTDEGVHVENSPGYHSWVSAYVVQINNFAKHYTGRSISKASKYLAEGGLKFLVAITRPDGFLPRLGDTFNNVKVKAAYPNLKTLSWFIHYQYLVSKGEMGKKPDQTTFIFPSSGYFVYRDFWDNPGENTATHLIMKCGYLANGHRHDDDGNILLYGFGEDWLIDSGMYGYKRDEYRTYARSAVAHNLSLPYGIEASRDLERKVSRYEGNWGITSWSDTHVTCESHMFLGYTYRRRLIVKGPRLFELFEMLVPEDRYVKQPGKFVTIFRVPDDKTVYINGTRDAILVLNAKGTAGLQIRFDPSQIADVRLNRGVSGEIFSLETAAWQEMKPAKAIIFNATGRSYTANFKLSLMRNPDIDDFRKMDATIAGHISR